MPACQRLGLRRSSPAFEFMKNKKSAGGKDSCIDRNNLSLAAKLSQTIRKFPKIVCPLFDSSAMYW
jgi:hypothetical protein